MLSSRPDTCLRNVEGTLVLPCQARAGYRAEPCHDPGLQGDQIRPLALIALAQVLPASCLLSCSQGHSSGVIPA